MSTPRYSAIATVAQLPIEQRHYHDNASYRITVPAGRAPHEYFFQMGYIEVMA